MFCSIFKGTLAFTLLHPWKGLWRKQTRVQLAFFSLCAGQGPLTLGGDLPFAARAAECQWWVLNPTCPEWGTLHNQGPQGSRRLFICNKQQSAKFQDYVKLVSIRTLASHTKLSRAQDSKWLDGGGMSLDVFPSVVGYKKSMHSLETRNY